MFISNLAQAEIGNKVQDILRTYNILNWHIEPYHHYQNPAEGRYATIKNWVNNIMNRTGALANTWLLCMMYVCYILNRIASSALSGITPLQALSGVSPDIIILTLFKFFEPVYYATHNQFSNFPSKSEERKGYFVGFSEHVGDAMTFKVLTADTHKVIYRSAVRSAADPDTQNKRLDPPGGEKSPDSTPAKPVVYLKSRHDDDPGKSKPMPGFDPDDLVGRTFLKPLDENGERHRATVKKKIIVQEETDTEQDQDDRISNILYTIDIGNGKADRFAALGDHGMRRRLAAGYHIRNDLPG